MFQTLKERTRDDQDPVVMAEGVLGSRGLFLSASGVFVEFDAGVLSMNAETYKTLTEKEKMLHDEMFAFCKRLTDEMVEIRLLLEKAFKDADA